MTQYGFNYPHAMTVNAVFHLVSVCWLAFAHMLY